MKTHKASKIIFNNEKIGIFGDYDVDGSSTTLSVLEISLDFDIYTVVKKRLQPQYKVQIINRENVKVIFTVDCGTLSFEAINFAKKGVDVIVSDVISLK